MLLSYLLNDLELEKPVLKKWLLFQNENGSFSTYFNEAQLKEALDDSNLNNVNGWLSSHNCVSAVSFYFLAQNDQQSNSFIKIKKYFDGNLETKINSYWWTSEIYTLYYLAKSYHLLNEINSVNIIINKIKSFQNENGSFSDNYGENLFYTGLALEILQLDKSEILKREINKTILFLLQNQFSDGSWQNSNALQVPNSEDENPSTIPFNIATFGMNVRAKEFSRLFTTTSILQSLSIYGHKYSTPTL